MNIPQLNLTHYTLIGVAAATIVALYYFILYRSTEVTVIAVIMKNNFNEYIKTTKNTLTGFKGLLINEKYKVKIDAFYKLKRKKYITLFRDDKADPLVFTTPDTPPRMIKRTRDSKAMKGVKKGFDEGFSLPSKRMFFILIIVGAVAYVLYMVSTGVIQI